MTYGNRLLSAFAAAFVAASFGSTQTSADSKISPDNPQTVAELLRHVDPKLAIKSGTIWKKRVINVCWENPASKNVSERDWTRAAVEESWQAVTNLEFVGWKKCPPPNALMAPGALSDIRIKIEDTGPHVKKLGKRLDGYPNGMVLNFTFGNWSRGCANRREYCIKVIAVHEFGHAIGIAHEHNREDSSEWCKDEPQGTDPDVYVTPWDPRSVMNYCNKRWSGEGKLSLLDIQGAQLFYGVREQYADEVVGQVLLVKGSSLRRQWIPVRLDRRPSSRLWLFADVNGDNKADLVSTFRTNIGGESQLLADAYLANGNGFDRVPVSAASAVPVYNHPWLVGDFDGNGDDELFNAYGGAWYVANNEGGEWNRINSSGVGIDKLAVGDFDGDGKADIFSANGSSWKVSYGGASRWTKLNTSSVRTPNLAFGDFDADGKTDVFRSNGEIWQVSFAGSSKWTQIGASGISPKHLRIADMDGDGVSDVVRLGGGVLRVSFEGRSKWQTLVEGVPDGDIRFADFNGDGVDDLFVFTPE